MYHENEGQTCVNGYRTFHTFRSTLRFAFLNKSSLQLETQIEATPVHVISANISGFRIDGIPEQLNFLFDENKTTGRDGTMTHCLNSMIDMAM